MCRVALVALALFTQGALASDLEQASTLLRSGRGFAAIEMLTQEIDRNPAHEAARILLAQAYEQTDRIDEAIQAWTNLIAISHSKTNLGLAQRALSRLRREQLDALDVSGFSASTNRVDPFKIPMPDIDWDGLEVIEDSRYLPPILPPPHDYDVPPFAHQTEHFTVYSTNERLSRLIGERAETYLDFMVDRLFGGRSWAVRFPILVYQSARDYQQHGGPAGTAGVTMSHVTGKTQLILLFQLKPDFSSEGSNRSSRGRSSGEVWKYGIESVLPHELTHAVLNEFFAGRRPPQWLHEAVAGRFEQTRDHYGEAARLARKVVAGEYFRMRDLFDQKRYPARVALFYEQSAAVVLYLFEAGAEAMQVFLGELAAGRGHDAACAAAIGIDEEGAVEEFERRWVEWMHRRYEKDLRSGATRREVAVAKRTTHAVFLPWVDEMDTLAQIDGWRDVDLNALRESSEAEGGEKKWSVNGGVLRCNLGGDGGVSLLALRMNETAPLAVRCNVRYLGGPGERGRWFGFAQLDADFDDTRSEALCPLRANTKQEVACILGEDLAIYLNGICTGRYPAGRVSGNARDVDYPLGIIAHGPVEITNLQVASIRSFSKKPVTSQDADSPRERRGRGGRARRPRP